MSDVDGTLITPDGAVPPRNIEAITRFVDKGGKFAIATGRSPMWIRYLVEALPVNAPCAAINGCILYDFGSEMSLWEQPLPVYTHAYVDELTDMSPQIGMVVMTKDNYYNIRNETALVQRLMKSRRSAYVDPVDWRSVRDDWFKVLLLIPDGYFDSSMAYLAKKTCPGVRFTPSGYNIIEMMPDTVNKGTALLKLAEISGYDMARIAAIGDFYNDIEMLETAGIGAAVGDAPDAVRSRADLVLGPCAGGAVADLIEHLEHISAGA
jgi:Cof subfamily protein (haloacid dehalogenase superfamily)